MKKFAILLLLCCYQFFAIAAEMHIMRVSAPPAVDADASDWGTTWTEFGLHNAASTTNDMTGKFQLGYDNDCLYVIAEINDASPNNDSTIINSYERDCMEVFISMDMDTIGIGTKYHDGVWQIRKQRSPEEGGVDGNNGKVGGGDNWNITPLTSSAKFKAMSSGPSSPYYVEMALPWDSLGYNLRTKWGGREFWFDIAIADNTTGAAGGRTDQKYWNDNSDDQWHNTSKFGKVIFNRTTCKKNGLNLSNTNCSEPIFVEVTDSTEVSLTGNLIHKESIIISPNPITNTSTIEILDGDFERLILTDIFGRQVKVMNIQNQTSIVFSRVGLFSGLYFIRLFGKEKSSEVYKLVIN